jgi:hypothetical protein
MTRKEYLNLSAETVKVIYTGPIPRYATAQAITIGKTYTLINDEDYIFYDDDCEIRGGILHYPALTLLKEQP